VLHLFPHWNWPDRIGQEITVGCFSNDDAVELLLNSRSLGKKDMPRNGHLEWTVAYQPGTLEARGYRAGQVVETSRIETTGQPAAIQLVPQRAQLTADGADVAVVEIKVVDAQGRTVPTAGNEISFELQGPGRILGVGNGDPGSHEPDRVVDGIRLLPVDDWRGRIAPPATTTPGASEAQAPLPQLGNWLAPLPKPGEVYDLSATFTIDALPPAAKVRLFLPALGARTTVWVNGHETVRDLDTAASGPALLLDSGRFSTGLNRVQMIVVPRDGDRNHLPEQTRLGNVQVWTPAAAYQRRAFNGYAQVIVQTTREAGEIRLTAHAEGLQPAAATLTAKPNPVCPTAP
jgi:beta-galactosidase